MKELKPATFEHPQIPEKEPAECVIAPASRPLPPWSFVLITLCVGFDDIVLVLSGVLRGGS